MNLRLNCWREENQNSLWIFYNTFNNNYVLQIHDKLILHVYTFLCIKKKNHETNKQTQQQEFLIKNYIVSKCIFFKNRKQ